MVNISTHHLKTLLAARLAVVSFFMGLVVFLQARDGSIEQSAPGLATIVAAYSLSIIYAIALKHVKNVVRFVYIQITFDLLLVTSIIFCTGGVNSHFTLLYILVILSASILLWRRDTYLAATAASLLYSLLIILEYHNILRPIMLFPIDKESVEMESMALKAAINIAVFFIVAYLGGSLADILRRKERQLERQSEDFTMLKAFHENVLENMGSGFIAVNLNRIILSHNPAVETMLGLDGAKINNRKIEDLLQLPRLKRFFAHINDMEGSLRQFNWTYKRDDGSRLHIALNASKFVVEGALQGVIMALHDVTGIKKMERQVADAKRLAAIGRVAAGIAHEIRNPLASLSGSIQMLNSDTDANFSETDRRLMDISMREAERLNNIISQFLSYASPAKLNPAVADLSEILLETIMLLKTSNRAKEHVTFVEDIDEDLNALVDQEQIRQVIWNLCINAMDAMSEDGVLTVKASRDTNIFERRQSPRPRKGRSQESFGNYIKITVSDTGSGIDNDNLEKIFEPFFTTKQVGTGLGLSTVHKIIESHGGKIMVNSALGEGTVFNIWLPVEAALEAAAAPRQ